MPNNISLLFAGQLQVTHQDGRVETIAVNGLDVASVIEVGDQVINGIPITLTIPGVGILKSLLLVNEGPGEVLIAAGATQVALAVGGFKFFFKTSLAPVTLSATLVNTKISYVLIG
jgi:hypothetical protein